MYVYSIDIDLHCKLSHVPISLSNRMAIKKEIIMVATRHGVTPPPSVERQLAVLDLTSVLLSETKYVVYTYTMKGEVAAVEGKSQKMDYSTGDHLDSTHVPICWLTTCFLCAPQQSPL